MTRTVFEVMPLHPRDRLTMREFNARTLDVPRAVCDAMDAFFKSLEPIVLTVRGYVNGKLRPVDVVIRHVDCVGAVCEQWNRNREGMES